MAECERASGILGVDIGGTKCALVKADAAGRAEREMRFGTTDVSGTLANI